MTPNTNDWNLEDNTNAAGYEYFIKEDQNLDYKLHMVSLFMLKHSGYERNISEYNDGDTVFCIKAPDGNKDPFALFIWLNPQDTANEYSLLKARAERHLL